MRTLLLLSMALSAACLEQAQALGLVKNLPPPIERAAPETRTHPVDLCCFDSMCVEQRTGPDVCDAGLVPVDCDPVRVGAGSFPVPLWECR